MTSQLSERRLRRSKVYTIPREKIGQSLNECLHSALNFWQAGTYVAEKGGLHIAVGLWILGIEEIGKYGLLDDAASLVEGTNPIRIHEIVFKDHRIKSEKGRALLRKWGIDLATTQIPLTPETREGLWYVSWDEEAQEFKRYLGTLEIGAFWKTGMVQELFRRGLNKMQELQRRPPPVPTQNTA